MTVVLDTNAIVQMFGARSPLAALKDAIVGERLGNDDFQSLRP